MQDAAQLGQDVPQVTPPPNNTTQKPVLSGMRSMFAQQGGLNFQQPATRPSPVPVEAIAPAVGIEPATKETTEPLFTPEESVAESATQSDTPAVPIQNANPAPEPLTAQPEPVGQQQQSATVQANQAEILGVPPEELVYDWRAPSRPFKQRNRQFFTTVFTIALLICLILFFAGQFLPIAVVIAVAFLSYVMASIPPGEVVFQITTYGIRVEEELYYWDELGRFWFTDEHKQRALHVEVGRFPFKLTMMLGAEAAEDTLTEVLSLVLLHQRPAPTVYERTADWIQKKIPLDIES